MESEGTKGSSSESSLPAAVPDPEPTDQSDTQVEEEKNPADMNGDQETTSYDGKKEIVKAMEVLERDSLAIAGSFTSLFSSLRLVLSQVTSTSVDHMNCFSDAAGGLQECVLNAATKGNRYINTCLRLGFHFFSSLCDVWRRFHMSLFYSRNMFASLHAEKMLLRSLHVILKLMIIQLPLLVPWSLERERLEIALFHFSSCND